MRGSSVVLLLCRDESVGVVGCFWKQMRAFLFLSSGCGNAREANLPFFFANGGTARESFPKSGGRWIALHSARPLCSIVLLCFDFLSFMQATRYLSTSPWHHAAAAKIGYPKTGMPPININYMKSVLVDSSRRSMQTSSTRIHVEPSSASQLAASGASYRRFLRNVRLVACGLSLVWAITLYSAWSNPHRRSCNGRCGHSKSSMKRAGQVVWGGGLFWHSLYKLI